MYCKKNDEGLLFRIHKTCLDHHKQGLKLLEMFLKQLIQTPEILLSSKEKIQKIITDYKIKRDELKKICLEVFADALEHTIADKFVSKEEEQRLETFYRHFKLSRHEISLGLDKLKKFIVIRDLLEGKLPIHLEKTSSNFNLQKGEILVWHFPETLLFEDKQKKSFVGGSAGVRLRVAKGVYFKLGAFKRIPVSKTNRILIGEGNLGVTNKNLYFTSQTACFRIPFRKVISFSPLPGGVGILKEGAKVKYQELFTGDGWFTYNLIFNLARMAQ